VRNVVVHSKKIQYVTFDELVHDLSARLRLSSGVAELETWRCGNRQTGKTPPNNAR
jgi:hypothetical protein